MKYSNYTPKYYINSLNTLESISEHQIGDGMSIVVDNNQSKGNIVDRKTGKRYLDFFTCFASMPLGYNHPKMLESDFIDYIGINSINKPSNSDLYTEVQATFTNTLFKVAVPKDDFKYSFYIEGGALAVENALKAAMDWKVRKNIRKGLSENIGTKVLHFKQAFHGRSGYTLSITNTDPVKVMYFPKFDWPRVDNPKIIFPIENNIDDIINRENESIRQIEQAFIENKNEICSIIIEPIQGEGGDNHFRDEFFIELRRICDENEALLIFDEVQTGVGMTGKMWAYQHLTIKPDIICFGKKMQVCGILSNTRIDEVDDNVFHKSSRINSTWGGNYTDMVRITKYLEIIEEENLVSNSDKMGNYLHSLLQNLQIENHDIISNVRGKGLFRAFDIQQELRKPLLDKCFENGLIVLACGNNSVRFRTRLNITERELDEGISIITKSISQIK
ncbi:MAG: L-lysine 6-transaminase [Ignavibacteriae bacterium HGW-Ignavibacteriae-4]|jgi:L-lysine 6-transaminase|nr:MAG: L-lysine 6-transaminase [Ignavibacteriae bacterium HGW-Ignavibacteriae-4]